MSQLEKDLQSAISERLTKWITDSITLYEMGGMEAGDAFARIIMELIVATATVAITVHIPGDKLAEAIKLEYEAARQHLQRRSRK